MSFRALPRRMWSGCMHTKKINTGNVENVLLGLRPLLSSGRDSLFNDTN